MEIFNQNLMYEFHTKDLTHVELFKQYADQVVKEIKSTVGWDTDVQVTIEPEAKDKRIFNVSVNVFGLHEPINVHKAGKHALTVLRKVRKAVLRQLHRMNERKIRNRRKGFHYIGLNKKKGGIYVYQ